MIIATSILTAVYYFQPSSKTQEQKIVENEPLTDEEVQAYLNNNGYISIPQQTYNELLAKSKEYEVIKNESQKAPELKQPETNPPEQKEPVPNPQPPEIEKQEPEKKTYTLTVKSGMDSIQIANLLEKFGVVDSGQKFEQFLTTKDWTKSIQVGTYKLDSSMSYEEIGKVITKKN